MLTAVVATVIGDAGDAGDALLVLLVLLVVLVVLVVLGVLEHTTTTRRRMHYASQALSIYPAPDSFRAQKLIFAPCCRIFDHANTMREGFGLVNVWNCLAAPARVRTSVLAFHFWKFSWIESSRLL